MTVLNASQLLADGPSQLLDRALDEYAAFLRQTEEVQREHGEAVDYAVRHTVVRLLVRGADEDELTQTYDSLRRLVPVSREPELREWSIRWRGMADLVDARLQSLAHRDVDKARSLLHVEDILAVVSSRPGLTQTEIAETLELSAANLSRILGVMEAHELIERRRVGREKRVHQGRLAGDARPVQETASDPVDRFSSYLYAGAA